jgi:hypothetical protein
MNFTHRFGQGIARKLGVKYRGIVYKGGNLPDYFIFGDPFTRATFPGKSVASARENLDRARLQARENKRPKETGFMTVAQ